MSQTPGQTPPEDAGDSSGNQFNHDLLRHRDPEKQKQWHGMAEEKWPLVKKVVIDTELIQAFGPYEDRARFWKKTVRRVGTLVVILMTAVFGAAIADVYGLARGKPVFPKPVEIALAVLAVISLVLAFLVSPRGPFRRRWMENRFYSEILRLWHFRNFLSPEFVVAAGSAHGAKSALHDRSNRLKFLKDTFEKDRWAKLHALATRGRNPMPPSCLLEHAASSHRPAHRSADDPPQQMAEIMKAYGELRILHQCDFFEKRTSKAYPDFAWIDSQQWTLLLTLVTGVSLGFGLLAAGAVLFMENPPPLLPAVVTGLTVLGVAVRSWSDGMRFDKEQEHYALMHTTFEALLSRWKHATTIEEKLEIAADVEEAAMDDLRGFLNTHLSAQFVI